MQCVTKAEFYNYGKTVALSYASIYRPVKLPEDFHIPLITVATMERVKNVLVLYTVESLFVIDEGLSYSRNLSISSLAA